MEARQIVRITLKGTPPSLNRFMGRTSSWEYRNAKKEWTNAVAWLAKKQAPPKPYRMADVTLLYYFPTRIRHDADNYCGKFLLDGLTQAGVIIDDDLSHIHLHIGGDHDKENPRTVITVIGIEEG